MFEHRPYSISINAITGNSEGVLLVQKSNWSGLGIVFSRSDLKLAFKQGLARTGIYLLFGEDPDETSNFLTYIGQSENVGNRLSQHIRSENKDFWQKTVVFVSDSPVINRAHVSFIESQLVHLAQDSNHLKVMNETKPRIPSLSVTDEIEAGGFLSDVLAILPMLGYMGFEKTTVSKPDSDFLYLTGPDANGQGELRSDGFLVFNDSLARLQNVKSFPAGWNNLRSRLIEKGIIVEEGNSYRFIQNYLFTSPSAASSILLGRNSNGPKEWKDSKGNTLKELETDTHEVSDVHRRTEDL